MGKRNPKRNRATKVNIIFDEDERREFLNGKCGVDGYTNAF